jgi:CrcB protein
MSRVVTYLWIAIGGALGSVARYGASNLIDGWLGPTLPWGTILVNISGSFVIGFVAALTDVGGAMPVSRDARLFLMVGICGGYTTFSSFSLQTLNLIRAGQIAYAGVNIGVSVVACILAVWLGYLAATALRQGRAG